MSRFELVVVKGATLDSVEYKSTIQAPVLPNLHSEFYIPTLGRNVTVKRIVYRPSPNSAIIHQEYYDISVYCE